MLSEIAAFSVAALVITLTPGADMALVARRGVADGYGTALLSRARARFLRPRWRATLERVTGAVLVGLGVRLGAATR